MSMHRRGGTLLLLSLMSGTAFAQASLPAGGYTQDFNSLSNTAGSTTNTSLPAGWEISESGGGARDNEQYAVDTGASNTGDTYSYGGAGSTERALGSLRSGTLISRFGACLRNDTGAALTALEIAYTGEQWRLGTASRTDTLTFEYSTDATSLSTGTWTAVPTLGFTTPNTATTGAKDGNAVANRTAVSATVDSVFITNGAVFCVRWSDNDASGADDGLAIDDVSIGAGSAPLALAINDVTAIEGDSGTVTFNFTVALNQPAPAGGVSFDIATADNTATAGSDYVARSLTGQTIAEGDSSYTFAVTVNGDDAIEGANETFFVNVTNVTGAAVTDAQGLGTITEDDFPILAIHEIQGGSRNSPRAGQFLYTRGIVTAVRTAGYYLQTPDAEADADPLTSQGIYVFTGNNNVPAQAVVGNLLEVSGTVVEYTPSNSPHQQPLTELTGTAVTALVSSGNALPAPVEITAALADPAGPVDSLERLEGMRVSVGRLVATAPGEGFIDENDALSSANGNFWGVVEGVARPFREEGVGALDVTPGIPANTPVFDTNPERIRVQSTGQVGAPVIALDAQAIVTGLVGVLDYGFGTYTLLPDPGAPVVVEGGAEPRAVADPHPSEFTIAGFNLLRFYDDVNDAGGDVALTTVAFERRVAKTARAICEYVKTPDILGVVEVENLNALSRLANAINTNVPGTCARNPQYVPYLVEGNDVGKINIGFLVSTAEVRPSVPRVQVLEVVQYGKDELISNPNGSTSILHDRPPLVLRAVMNGADGSAEPVTVVGNHLLSLIDINSLEPGSNGYPTTGDRRRTKRALQAVYTAGLIEQFQQANPSERIVLLGDFNAFEFNDGYVDVMGIITGREAANDAVLQYADSPLTVPMTTLGAELPEGENYSFSFEGNAQTLDHVVVNAAMMESAGLLRLEHARINADFGVDNFGDDSVPLRVSDHDPAVLYFAPATDADVSVDVVAPARAAAGSPAAFSVVVGNAGPEEAQAVLVGMVLPFEANDLVVDAPAGFACAAPVVDAGSTRVDCAATRVAVGSHAIGLAIGTTPAMVGQSLSVQASAQTASNDAVEGNNEDTASVVLAAPQADLALAILSQPTVATGRSAVVQLQVANRAGDASSGLVLSATFDMPYATLEATAPAGWTCATSTVSATRKQVSCSHAGRYEAARADAIGLTVRTVRPTTVNWSARIQGASNDPAPGNNAVSGKAAVLALRAD